MAITPLIYLYINYVILTYAQSISDSFIPKDTDAIIDPHNQKEQLITGDRYEYQQNHKPMFKDCDTYRPEVEEEQQRGAHVITVHADDIDPEERKGGKITYNIVQRQGDQVNFIINGTTGDIYTNRPFDRDEPTRQKELYLTVQATDDGRPVLADLCTFKVTVIDINDNSPSFDQMDYRVKVAEDVDVNSEVMRVFAYDFDDGENSRLTYSFANDTHSNFIDYFWINPKTGVVYLKQPLKGKQGTQFMANAAVQDNGEIPNRATVEVYITVVGSDKKAPVFKEYPKEIDLNENFFDPDKVLIAIEADSKIADKSVAFELLTGKTIQTNKIQTFQLNPTGNSSAIIRCVRNLDYETVTEYQLTVRAQNKDLLSTTVNIKVKINDVNDEVPTFIELLKGSIVENDVVGAQAMTVRAVDKDGTSPFNLVNYQVLSFTNLFEINKETGVITAKVQFDRENTSIYYVTVRAYDLAPSALFKDKTQPNSVNQTFTITIEDRNDNKPVFVQKIYIVHNISENTNKMKDVVEVKANDVDAASVISYSIIDGNIGDAFSIEESTGRIKVAAKLDFEKIESYNLTVRAFDGIYEDTAYVVIYIDNENDEPPVFEEAKIFITIKEETIPDGCIWHVKAYDPDIRDRTADQRIVYKVSTAHQWFLNVDNDGCVTLITKLDRDRPSGSPKYQGFIYAYDDMGSSTSLSSYAELEIILEDINDNYPILNITEVVWYENQNPGRITVLSAIDYDAPENGPPFKFEIDHSMDHSGVIADLFEISDKTLLAKKMFDREEKKFYDIPIRITDSGEPPQSGTSVLRVIIGDVNDNEAQDGSSEIFVYKYENLDMDIDIGRVYVEDLDDWDLADKTFRPDGGLDEYFDLGPGGMIVMRPAATPGEYNLRFVVTEYNPPDIPAHDVQANVTVFIKDIREEAVRKSGSIRLKGTTIENFVEKNPLTQLSKKDILQQRIAKILNTSLENVDVFTVLPSPSNESYVDVRFSAHGSPYYAPERLNNEATKQQEELERELDVEFVMININECMDEAKACPAKSSCSNVLAIKSEPAVVFTNRTSFVGVKAIAEPVCDCINEIVGECLNGGLRVDGRCTCPDGFEGPNCEILSVGFNGNGWAMYRTFEACNNTDIQLNVRSESEDGLIFYVGPLTPKHALLSKDYMSLELRKGEIVLKLDLGHGAMEFSALKKINVGEQHKIKISLTTVDVQIYLDESTSDQLAWKAIAQGGLLNVNGPLQVGGRSALFSDEESKTVWDISPSTKGFFGCISNFTYNNYVYNLGAPPDSHLANIGCNNNVAQAVTFGIDSNFLVAILVCIAILLILLLAVVVHKRKQDNLNEKDMDDTRENIINYEDEGGGECDTNFDLSVLRPTLDEKPPIRDNLYKQGIGNETADIGTFLDTKKQACDKDNLPYDDVRHYGYEGDGNTSGSLSSLASCTDEGDLKFNYLSSFGPRFRKLADMYGDDASEEDSQNGGEESWC